MIAIPDFSNAVWHKSRRSGSSNGGGGEKCVEVAFVPGVVGVRDSKHRAGGHIVVDNRAFGRFLTKIKAGELDRP
jgi:Domain of unknown function (DUF397)